MLMENWGGARCAISLVFVLQSATPYVVEFLTSLRASLSQTLHSLDFARRPILYPHCASHTMPSDVLESITAFLIRNGCCISPQPTTAL
jgi:hypothetical protein